MFTGTTENVFPVRLAMRFPIFPIYGLLRFGPTPLGPLSVPDCLKPIFMIFEWEILL